MVTAVLGPASHERFHPGMTLSLTAPLSRGLDTLPVIGVTRVTVVLCIGDSAKFLTTVIPDIYLLRNDFILSN